MPAVRRTHPRRAAAARRLVACVVAAAAVTSSLGATARASTVLGPRATALSALHAAEGWVAAGVKVKVATKSELSQLADDEYAWIPDSACLATAINSKVATPCVLGDASSETTVAVYGDSSADQWALDIGALGTAHHFRVVAYVKAACPVGDVLVEIAGESVDPSCASFRSTVLSDLAAMRPAPGLVLTSELRLSNYETPSGGVVTNASWSSGLATTLDQLEKDGLAVASLHGVPVATLNPPTCIAAHPKAVQRCTTPRKAADPSGYDAATLAGTLAAHGAGIDVTPMFCTSTACPDVADNDLTHAGDNHVDETYAKAVEAAFGELIGCITAQRFTNKGAAAAVLADLDGTKPPKALLTACAALKA